jgi:hypothetical protein
MVCTVIKRQLHTKHLLAQLVPLLEEGRTEQREWELEWLKERLNKEKILPTQPTRID